MWAQIGRDTYKAIAGGGLGEGRRLTFMGLSNGLLPSRSSSEV